MRHMRVPGAMQRAALRGVMLRRTGTVPSTGVWYGPGSAAHRFARATRCTASGERRSISASIAREQRVAYHF